MITLEEDIVYCNRFVSEHVDTDFVINEDIEYELLFSKRRQNERPAIQRAW